MNRIPRDRTMKTVAIVVASTFITTGVLAQTGTEREDPNRTTRPGQQDRMQDQRAGMRNPELAPHLQRIQMLEGEWDVKVEVLAGSGSAASKAVTGEGTAKREWVLNKNLLNEKFEITDVTAGTGGETRPGAEQGGQSTQQKQQQIEALITRTLTTETEMERTEAQQAAQRIARDVVQKLEQGQSGDLGQTLATHLQQAGVDRTEARQVATELEQQIRRIEGQNATQPGQRPTAGSQPKDMTAKLQGYKGLGLFGYDLESDRYSHLWADSSTGCMILSLGEMDDRTRTIIFSRHHGVEADARGRLESEIERARETAQRGDDDADIDIDDDEDPEINPIYGRDTPTLDRPDARRGAGDPTVVLEIVSDQKHVIRMLEQKEDGTSVQYQITYTKKGTSQPATPGTGIRDDTIRNPGSGN